MTVQRPAPDRSLDRPQDPIVRHRTTRPTSNAGNHDRAQQHGDRGATRAGPNGSDSRSVTARLPTVT